MEILIDITMMKISFTKFILILALALVGMSACYSSDLECMDNSEVASKVIKEMAPAHADIADQSTSHSNSGESDNHHCLCSLTCHTMFIPQSNFENFTYTFYNFPKKFQYTSQFYPQVITSLEKPPTV